MKIREDHVRSVLDEARRRLGEITKNPQQYRQILHKLMLQALYQIMEHNVILRCREVDRDLIEDVLPDVMNEYKSHMGKDTVLAIDHDIYLPPDTCGGVELIALNGRVKVSYFL